MLDYTEIMTDITMYVVIFNDVYIWYTSQVPQHNVISVIILVRSSNIKLCNNFFYSIFSVHILLYVNTNILYTLHRYQLVNFTRRNDRNVRA